MRRKIVVLCLSVLALCSLLLTSTMDVGAQETGNALGAVSYGFDPGTVTVCDTTQSTSLMLKLEKPPGALHDLNIAFHNPTPLQGSENRSSSFMVTVTASEGQTEFSVPLLFPPDRPGPKGAKYGEWRIDFIEVRDIATGEVQRYELDQAGPSFTVQPCALESAPEPSAESGQLSGDTFDILGYEFSPSTVVACDTTQTTLLKLRLAQPLSLASELTISLHNQAPDQGLGRFAVTVVAASEGQTEFTIPLEIYPEVYGKKHLADGEWSIEYFETFDKKTWATQRYELTEPGPTFTVQPCTATNQTVVAGSTGQTGVAGGTGQTGVAGATGQTAAGGQSVAPTPTPIPTPRPTPNTGLAYTGSNDNMLVLIGIGLILNGLVLVEFTRRKALH